MGKRTRNAEIKSSAIFSPKSRIFGGRMAVYLMCVTIPDGNVIFTRKIGDLKTLPLSTVGVLNGMNMFSSTCGFKLYQTQMCDSRIVWRDYHESLRFILITSDDGNNFGHFDRVLDNIFDTLVIFLGLERIKTINNVEKLKKDLQVCFEIVDDLLEQLNQETGTMADVTGCTDCLLSADNSSLQKYLDEFVHGSDTVYGCVLVRGKVAVATNAWWKNLHFKERFLIGHYVTIVAKSSSHELPVYLPYTSPTIPHRLLTFQLISGVHVCLLCGHYPSLHSLQLQVPKFWRDAYVNLKSLVNLQPRNFPSNWLLDKNILSFMLLDKKQSRCLVSYQPGSLSEEDVSTKKETSGKITMTSIRKRQEILRAFYKHAVELFCTTNQSEESDFTDESHDDSQQQSSASPLLHECCDVYVCLDHHKCYATNSNDHQLYIIFNEKIPNYALRSVCCKTLKILLGSKSVHL